MKRLLLIAAAVFCALTATPAKAGLILTYVGQTGANSSIAGTPIASGTLFTVRAEFPAIYSSLGDGVPFYSVDSIFVETGGTSYTAIFAPGAYEIALADTAISFMLTASLMPASREGGFTPAYDSVTTPGWSPLAPSATRFVDLIGSWGPPLLALDTAQGALNLDYVTVAAEISESGSSETPEPATLLLGLTGLAGIAIARRRRA